MSNKDGGPAFPGPEGTGMGMTLRDYFAGQALVGMMVSISDKSSGAKRAYEMADAMLAERSKGAKP